MKNCVAIIGAGPAGMSAALQLSRYGIKTILFEQSRTGSLLKNAWCVENYLGVSTGKSGTSLLNVFRKVLAKNKIEIVYERVELLDYNSKSRLFKIKTCSKNYLANYTIVAAGTNSKILPLIKKAKDLIKPYLLYEVFPILKERHKTIIIVGAGDMAFDNALNLSKHNKVIICDRNKNKNNLALPLLFSKALKHPNIAYYQDYKLQSILPGDLNNLKCRFNKETINADYLIAAIGRVPQKDFYSDKLKLLERKLLKLDKLFLIGDIKNNIYRQVAIAVGDGILAAMHIFRDLTRLK